jgi:hypothetical protein
VSRPAPSEHPPAGLPPLVRLSHVSGVLGSFTCTPSGQLLANHMPERFSLAQLESTAARLTNMFQTVDDAVPDCDSVKLAFADNQLIVRRYPLGLLCIVTAADCDLQMLLVTTRLVLRQLAHA